MMKKPMDEAKGAGAARGAAESHFRRLRQGWAEIAGEERPTGGFVHESETWGAVEAGNQKIPAEFVLNR